MSGPEDDPRYERCGGCGQLTDPEWCWCGGEIDKHLPYIDDHSPVRMGCTCGFVRSSDPE